MTLNEFGNVWNTLCNYYEKEYSKDVMNLYFNEMKYINGEYNELITGITNKCKYFPKIADIMEVWRTIKQENMEVVDINKPVCECNLCNGSGYRIIKEKSPAGGIYEFAVACDCHNGDNKLYDGRTIKDKKHRSNYICPRYSSVMPN